MATANPLILPNAPAPYGTAAEIGVTFTLAAGNTYTVTLTDPTGASAASGSVTFDGETAPVVGVGAPVIGQWMIEASGGTLIAQGGNTFSLAE